MRQGILLPWKLRIAIESRHFPLISMKTLPRITIKKNGMEVREPIVTVDTEGNETRTEKILTTGYLIKAALQSHSFATAKEQYDGFKIFDKIEDDAEEIQLEDAEFELVEKICKAYPPFLKGIMFIPFLELFEEAKA